MGQAVSAYLMYGFSLAHADVSEEGLDAVLQDHPTVGQLWVGSDGRREPFLTANVQRADLGKAKCVDAHRMKRTYEVWDRRLRAVVRDLGASDHDQPGWLLIADIL